MSRRKSQRMTVPKLSHDDAVQYLVEYHFGRLPPAVNAAVEAHVSVCRICQRQGLNHAATEKRDIARQIKRIRPGKRRVSRRGRNIIVLLAFAGIVQLAAYALLRSPIVSHGAAPGPSADVSVTQTATASTLTALSTFDGASAGTVALAASPDGKTIGGSMPHGASSVVLLWSAATGKVQSTLTWPGKATPNAIAWSQDGQKLVATDGATIAVWNLPAAAPVWSASAPEGPALQIYDAQSGSVLQAPSTSDAFANGTFLLWGANGQLTSAPAGAAGPSGVAAPGTPLVGLWQTSGSHLFAGGHGGAFVGVSTADVAGHSALLSWSPDGRDVLWGAVSQRVALSSTDAGVSMPDPVVAGLAQRVANSNSGDALAWFSPDGHTIVDCDRTSTNTDLRVFDVATGNQLASLPAVCDRLTVSSLTWDGTDGSFALAVPGQPIAIYNSRPAAKS